jgi:hypothetical protein
MADLIPDDFPISFFLKRGTLLGAALGMLFGLLYLSLVGPDSSDEVASIVVWRNCILFGAGAGLFLGAAAGWWYHSSAPDSIDQHRRQESQAGKQQNIS